MIVEYERQAAGRVPEAAQAALAAAACGRHVQLDVHVTWADGPESAVLHDAARPALTAQATSSEAVANAPAPAPVSPPVPGWRLHI